MNCPTCGAHVQNHGKFLIDTKTCRVTYAGTSVRLPPAQIDLLYLLHKAGPRGASFSYLLDRLAGAYKDTITLGSLQSQKCQLLKALKAMPLTIENIYGRGYRLVLS